jgi:hypothetical protein
MRHCDLATGLGRLNRAAAKLKERWQETKSHWNDKASRDFEKNFLQQLPPQLNLAVAAVHELADLLAEAERELEDRTKVE